MVKNPNSKDLLVRTNMVEKIVRQSISINQIAVGDSLTSGIYLFETMRIAAKDYNAFFDYEKKMAKIHEDRKNNGIISMWGFWRQIFPSSYNGAHYIYTVQSFPSITEFERGGYTEKLAKKYFNLSLDDISKKIFTLRSIESSWLARMSEKL